MHLKLTNIENRTEILEIQISKQENRCVIESMNTPHKMNIKEDFLSLN